MSQQQRVLPKNARPLINKMIEAGWSFIVQHSEDSGGCPYVSIEGRTEDREVKCTWHTRETGSYRLFTCLARTPGTPWHHTTLTKALEVAA